MRLDGGQIAGIATEKSELSNGLLDLDLVPNLICSSANSSFDFLNGRNVEIASLLSDRLRFFRELL